MKFLISTFSAVGHVNSFAGTATELVSRGHKVVWLCGPRFRDQICATGAHFEPWNLPACDADITPAIPDPGASGMAASVSIARAIWVDPMLAQVEEYQRVLKDFAADAIIVDMIGLGAMMVAELGGSPYVTIGTNPRIICDHNNFPPGWRHEDGIGQCDSWGQSAFMSGFKPLVDAGRAKLGLAPLPSTFRLLDAITSPYLHLMQMTAAFELIEKVQEPHLKFVGPMKPPPTTDFVPPPWWSELTSPDRDRFVVHVTQGTYTPESMDIEALIMPTIIALQHVNCLVIATSPLGAKAFPKHLPANVRIETFIPHSELLPFVDILVTNAGYNGVTTALSHGVPMICAGVSEDKADVSRLVAYFGAGINLKTNRPSKEAIQEAVKRIRDDPEYLRQAKEIQEDFASHDSAVESCDLIETLVERNRSDTEN